MNKHHIYTLGETVYDIILKNEQPVAARAGGAMLNTAVSLGRIGIPVSFISEIGKDEPGKYILNFLSQNRIDGTYIHLFSEGKTAVALAFLDDNEDARYEFYKNYPEKRLNIAMPHPDKYSSVLFGSFFAITPEVRDPLINFISNSREAGALIMYDPNIRKPHLKDMSVLKDYLLENFRKADLVRGSADDFKIIFRTNDPMKIFNHIRKLGCEYLILTDGSKPVHFISTNYHLKFPVPPVKPVSTVGAGDSFNAGILYGLYKMKTTRMELAELDEYDWENLIDVGITFGSGVCQSYENYISGDLIKTLNKFK